MQTILPLVRDLVLVGGGHTHALVLKRWGMKPVPGVRLTVINPGPGAAYSGMLPGFVAGHYRQDELEIDLVKLARFAGARLINGPAIALDPQAHTVTVPGRAPIGFDLASIDIGITAKMPQLPGFANHGLPAKPLDAFARGWSDFVEKTRTGQVAPQIAVIGGGIAGVELALTMIHRLKGLGLAPKLTLIDRGTILDGINAKARAILRTRASEAGVSLCENADVQEVTARGPRLSDGRQIDACLTIGAAGATPAPWLGETGLTLENGFIAVDATLRSLSHPYIFAVGDCAHFTASPRPKAGVFAVRAAPVLDDNLRSTLAERPLRPFRPQRSYLKLVSLGPEAALAQKGPLVFEGPMMWRWKDHIDRKFMDKLQNLPEMAPPSLPKNALPALRRALPSDKPMCGGCGAKVASGALSQVLGQLCAPQAAELINNPGDDAAILEHGGRWQVLSTDHLRAVTQDPEVMTRIALYHAMGDVWAMGADPQIALAQIVVPRMTAELQSRCLNEITTAADAAARQVGAALAGGHTTMGAEMTIGFTVTGTSKRPPITKAGARPGDILLLTRPLGSGTLLAAEMQGKARGAWIEALLGIMTKPQGHAAAALATEATAMTDVTGFGLAGHALEMAKASGVNIELSLNDLPIYGGAAAMVQSGIRSTIFDDNRAAVDFDITVKAEHPVIPLIYDPQTCGGLMAAMPPQAAMAAVARIAETGGRAWTIGRITDGAPGLTLV